MGRGLWRDEYAFREKLKLTFNIGHFLEEMVLLLLERSGYTILEQQTEVEWCGVVGHIDAIIGCPDGTERLIEIKSMNDRYYKQCASYGVDDERGYLTQLAAYSEALDLDATWVCINKNSSDVMFIDLDYTKGAARLDVVESYLEQLKHLECVDDLYRLPAPTLVHEVYKKERTGRYLLPTSLKYYTMRDLFVDVYVEPNGYGKDTEYCTLRNEWVPF
jgi:Holliday junction resolvase-like predicted endonuclease